MSRVSTMDASGARCLRRRHQAPGAPRHNRLPLRPRTGARETPCGPGDPGADLAAGTPVRAHRRGDRGRAPAPQGRRAPRAARSGGRSRSGTPVRPNRSAHSRSGAPRWSERVDRVDHRVIGIDPVEDERAALPGPHRRGAFEFGPDPADERLGELGSHDIIARVVDGSEFDEFKKLYGTTLICGFAHIGLSGRHHRQQRHPVQRELAEGRALHRAVLPA